MVLVQEVKVVVNFKVKTLVEKLIEVQVQVQVQVWVVKYWDQEDQ